MPHLPTASPERRQLPSRRALYLALGVALAFLAAGAAGLGDRGPLWDHVQGDYPYGERLLGYLGTGDERFLDNLSHEPEPEVRRPHLDLGDRRFSSTLVYPVGALLSALACRVGWTWLGVLSPMSAHHLPALLSAAALVFVVTFWAARRMGALAGLVAGGSLAFSPVFFGYAGANLKDVPECFLYTLAVLLGFRALERGSARAWLPAGVLTGLALAQKPNALFLPIQLVLFLALGKLLLPRTRAPRIAAAGVGWAALGFLGAWYGASPQFWSAPLEGPVRTIGFMLRSGSFAFRDGLESRATSVSLHAPMAVAHTIPLVTLALGVIGLFARRLSRAERLFLALGVTLPIARHFVPGMRSFLGVRHFLEFLPMLAILAGAGAALLADGARAFGQLGPRSAPLMSALALVLALATPIAGTIATHPYQTTYRNAAAGGLSGARARDDVDTVDLTCESYWEGLAWLSAHAEPGSTLVVPRGDFVARAAAPLRLRPDVHIWSDADSDADPYPLYVLALHGAAGGPAATRLDERSTPVHVIESQGAPLLRIHRIASLAEDSWYADDWLVECAARKDRKKVIAYLRRRPRVEAEVLRLYLADREGAFERIRHLFPPELQAQLESSMSVWSAHGLRVAADE